MVFQNILSAFIAVGAMGALLGLGLAFASRFLAVHKDQRIEAVARILPGINCGACGYAGCEAYAEAVVSKNEKLDLCKPGGADVTVRLGETMGVQVQAGAEKLVAKVYCGGGWSEAKRSYEYEGLEDCNAAYALYGGGKVCRYGCLGLGSCIKVCPVDAIEKTGTGLVRVNRELCISCEKCVEICPTGVMKMVPYSAERIVACNSTDKGGVVRRYCSVGCIGCKKCEKASPDGGFIVDDNLARIDYSKTGDRSAAEAACPTHCIRSVQPALVVTPSGNEPNEEH